MRCIPVVALLAAVLALSGCNGSNSSLPTNPQSVPQTAGDYVGTVTDSAMGSGTSAITFSQTGSSIGGTLVETFPGLTLFNTFALVTDLSGNLSGNAVATVANSACGFKVAATYNSTTGQLNGTYTAYSGCSGETASFTLTQQCTNPSSSFRRRDGVHGILPC
ncbi:MAG: hypothetical protein ABI282_10895 [Candidatus Baltobacteraceae bacterium]